MKLAVFGATGNTGRAVVVNALTAGHAVTVFVRNPDRLTIDAESKKQLTAVVEGDVLDLDAVRRAVAGQDAVIVTLGTNNELSPTKVLSEGTRNILTAMKEAGVRGISACISAFLFYEPDKVPAIFLNLHADHERMLEALRESDSDWVAVCPPHIADEPATGSYEVAIGRRIGNRISKHDLADFLVKSLSKDEFRHQTVGMGYSATLAL